MSDQTKLTQDQLMGKTLREEFGKAVELGYTEENTYVEVAGNLRKKVIDPAVIAGSLKLLKAHRDGLYESIPTGDIDAWGLLEIIQNHLAKVDETIAALTKSLIPEAEVVENADAES